MALEVKNENNGKFFICPRCGFSAGSDPEMPRQFQNQADTAETVARVFEEKRRHRRLEFRSMVEVDGEKALLFNVSRGGLMLSTPFHPKGPEVAVTMDSGELHFALKGAIRWVSKKRTFSNLVDFGVEILDPPPAYLEFVERMRRLD
jgi:hypothetical protein